MRRAPLQRGYPFLLVRGRLISCYPPPLPPHLQDFIELTMIPPDPAKAPFREMRLVVPVRLTTDPYSADGSMQGAVVDEFSTPSTPHSAEAPHAM